ncbi:MAG: hypothetical protein Q9202_005226 [Teloschistes flavicans]
MSSPSSLTRSALYFTIRARLCKSCLASYRRYASTTAVSAPSKRPPPPPPTGHAHLTNRALISVFGPDAAHFLQGLTTNNIQISHSRSAFSSAFLNAKGRVLYDVIIYPIHQPVDFYSSPPAEEDQGPGFLIDAERTQIENLRSHLKKFRLRAKIQMRVLQAGEADVWTTWSDQSNPDTAPHPASTNSKPGSAKPPQILEYPDPRLPSLGHRLISLTGEPPPPDYLPGPKVSPETYDIRRILHGIPQGAQEILPGEALPLESNLDYTSAIDFRKGCYIGQELTIRTHHTGIVRKRLLPVQLYPASSEKQQPPPERLQYDPAWTLAVPPQGQNIARVDKTQGRSAGRWVAGVGNVGFALCRLETMTDVRLTEEGGGWSPGMEFRLSRTADYGGLSDGDGSEEGESGVRVKAFVPEWHRGKGGVRETIQPSQE